MSYCFICNKDIECSIKEHLSSFHHNFSRKLYYDTYLKKQNEGKCIICNKEAVFKSIEQGYSNYCSTKCAWQTDEVKLKRKIKIAEKTDAEKSEWRSKILDNKISKYGCGLSDIGKNLRQQKSEQHFKDYLKTCNCTFIKYDYNDKKRVTFRCNKCNTIAAYTRALLDRYCRNNDLTICHTCNSKYTSKQEKQLYDFVKNNYAGQILMRDHTLIGKELDLVLPDLNLAIEFDGLYWHNDNVIKNDVHLIKTELCESKGYQLIHIFEDEWNFKQEIVKSRLLNFFHKSNRIFARKTKIKDVQTAEAYKFLNENHIQGACSSKYKLGLYYNDELVSLMTFGKSRFKKDEFELLRFCNKLNTSVIGGASKLFTAFCKLHPEVKNIVSYADRRWSKGNVYESLGFSFVHVSAPSYFYIVNHKRENRIKYQKHKLVANGADPTKTEHEIMKEMGFARIYDCGTIKYNFDNINST